MSEMIFDLQRFSVINNKSDNTLVSGTSDDDKITNSAANVTIAAGGGNDSIVNKEYADNMSISGGAGNDTIRNNGEYSSNTTITGDAGNDFIFNNSSDVTISGGEGNDNITNNGSYVSVSAGDGKNSVVNKGSNVTISGGTGNDSIKSTGENVLFQYAAGNDKISGFNATSSLQIGDGDATYTEKISGNNIIITVGKDKITLEGAAALGNINVIGKKLTPSQIKLTERADDYSNTVEGAIIDALAGNDSIYNNSDGSYSSILGGVGNDSIENDGSRVSIEGGLGNDYIGNWNDNYATTINGGAGNDHIENNGNFVIINGNEGNDTILSSYSNWYYGSNVTINGGDGNDSIRVGSKSDNSSINLGAGNDYLYTSGDNSTIIAGTGNDTIDINYERNEDYFHEANNGANNLFKYSSGDGNDLITGFRSDSTLQIGDGNDTYSSTVKGDDVIVTVGKGKITLVGAAETAVNIAGTALYNGHKYRVFNDNMTWEEAKAYCESLGGHLAVITSAGEQDFVYSLAKQGSENYYWLGGYRGDNDIWQWVTKETFSYSNWDSDEPNNDGGDENYIELYESVGTWNDNNNGDRSDIGFICEWEGGKASSSKAVTLTAGNDSYKNTVGGATINALGGNDTISNSGAKVKINGGTGNDSIKNSGANVVFNYANGDGNDKILGFNATSTLNITSGTYSTTKSGSDIVVTVGKGKITLKGAASLSTVNIKGTKAASTSLTVTDKTKSPVTVSAAIKTVDASARAKAVQITGNKLDNSITGGSGKDSLYGGAGNDTILGNAGNDKLYGQAGNDSLNGGAGNDSIAGGAGNNTLTGGAGNDVFFYNGGNDIITDYEAGDKIKISSGTAKVTTRGDNVVFTVGKGKLTVAGGKGKTINYVDAKGEHTYSDSATSNVSINGSGTTIKLLPTYLNDSFNIADYGATLQNVDASAVLLDMEIIGNALRNSILGGENNETLTGGKGNDTLTGGIGSDVFTYTAGDGNDLITDYAEEDLISIASGTVSTIKTSGKNLIFTVGNGNITVAGAADKIVSYVEGGTTKTYGDTISAVEVSGKTVTLTENYTADSFDLSSYAKTIKTVNASAVTRDLSITANDNANKIYGGSGNDTLIGGKGNDSLKGGSGSDLFIYSSGDGNDVITDYAEEDKIKITSGKVSVNKSGSDVIFTVGNGSITVKSAASKTVTYIDANGKTNYYPKKPSTDIILTDKNTTAILRETYSDSTYTAGSAIKKIDASAVTRDLTITGNGKANIIMGGYEDDTINGGKGNDTLQGGSGADVFTYANGDGKDIILDYDAEDTIQITKGTAQISTSGNDVIFTVGSGKLTLASAANKTVTYIESGKTKTYGSASNVLEDDNFIAGNDLSALVQSKVTDYFAVRESLIQKKNQLPSVTYSTKK